MNSYIYFFPWSAKYWLGLHRYKTKKTSMKYKVYGIKLKAEYSILDT
jgi:hypothetical protein